MRISPMSPLPSDSPTDSVTGDAGARTLTQRRTRAHAKQAVIPHYVALAKDLGLLIAKGTLGVGQRLPSVRALAAQRALSASTVVQALAHLEEQSLVQPRARSGYFVAPGAQALAQHWLRKGGKPASSASNGSPQAPEPKLRPVANFAAYSPEHGSLFEQDRIRTALARATRLQRRTLTQYSNSNGTPALRQAVALRAMHLGCNLASEDVVITSSCLHAVSLCLQAVTQTGDLVAVESPTFFGFLDLLHTLGRKALAIPCDARTGLSLPALELALQTQPIRAILAVPTLSNPLGAILPLTHKRQLAALAARAQVPLIEDVVFNDLLATDARRRAVRAFDTEGWVLTCGSFAKTVAPGIRLGWVAAGRWHATVANAKRVQGHATNAVLEHALADLLTQGSYEAHLRRVGQRMRERLTEARKNILAHFPKGTQVNDPAAGQTLWIRLPLAIDAMALFGRCQAEGILVGPGQLFCADQQYRHCIRLSFSGPWGAVEQAALRRVGEIAQTLMKTPTPAAHADISRAEFCHLASLGPQDIW
jgi:DNA-binding transcriptional MocR family regulator